MQTYKVSGRNTFDGYPPGSVFDADIPEERETRAIAAGHIVKSTAKPQEAEAQLTAAAAAAAVETARQEEK